MAAEGIYATNTRTERGLQKFALAALSFSKGSTLFLKKRKNKDGKISIIYNYGRWV